MRFRPSMLMLLAAAAAILPKVSLAAEVEDEDEANAIEDVRPTMRLIISHAK